ncbi:MAG: exosortase [Steroidobacteraceae bacterium]
MYPSALVLLGAVAAAALAVWPTWPALLTTWHVMPDYDYAELLVPFIVGWLAARCARLPKPTARMSPFALAALLAAFCVWLVAYQASSNIGEQLMVPAILLTALWTAFGLPIAKRMAVPVACLYFAIPLWEFLVPVLQSAGVWVAETVLGLVGVPVHIAGNLVSIPEGTFQIAEACAGRRYFVVCVTIAALLAGTSRMRPLRAISFMVLAGALAIVMNWIRILTVLYAGHITNMQSYLVRVEHVSFGWALFAVLMVIVCLIGSRLARSGTLPPTATEPSRGAAGVRELLMRPAVPITALVLLIPVLAIMYSRYELGSGAASQSDEAATVILPGRARGWLGPHAPRSGWRPRYQGAAATQRAGYQSAAGEVEVFIAQYGHEQPGAKLVSSANDLFPTDWIVLNEGVLAGGAGRGANDYARLLRLATPLGAQWEISYLYRVDGFVTRSAAAAQIARGVLGWTGPIRSRIAAVASRCRPSCEVAERRLEEFWSTAGPQLLGEPRFGG